jgi:NAD-dependent dihydropyrimidine dehydrogenase PreA subunit
MKREIISIDEEKCDGCGNCVPNCHEGALQIIDDKAVLVSDLMCDGLGACIGHCPQDALTIEEREAKPYDEAVVMKEMVLKGRNVVLAHMKHLKEHQEHTFLKQGVEYLLQNRQELDFDPVEVIQEVHQHGRNGRPQHAGPQHAGAQLAFEQAAAPEPALLHMHGGGGCPGSREVSFGSPAAGSALDAGEQPSALRQWPVQLHLINPAAGYFQGADLLVSADCVAYALGNFHAGYLQHKSLVIACPKLDSNLSLYEQKLTALIDQAGVNTVTVMIMEVPCCGGLLQLVRSAVSNAGRKVPVKAIQVGIRGEVLAEEWV